MRVLLLLVIVHQIFAEPTETSASETLTAETFSRCLNTFSLDLLKKLEYENKNVVYSSLSVGMAIGMLLEGAKDGGRDKLFQLLNCAKYGNRDAIHQQFKALLDEYKDMARRDAKPRNVTVELANLAMIQEGTTLPETFVDALKRDYEASVANENFESNGQQVVKKINKFVDERTHGLIPRLFAQPLDPKTVMLLVNTIYFKGYWQEFFRDYRTANATFHNADKTIKSVAMMKKYNDHLKYHHSEKHKAAFVELPYLGEMSMYLVVPDEKYGLPAVIKTLEHGDFFRVIRQMNTTLVDLYVPKFEFDYTINLKDVIKEMGVDLSDVLKPVHDKLEITAAIHKAKINIHETGTEAAAVTVIFAAGSSLPVQPPKEINCDHPFLFLIKDKKNSVNLFAGVVNKFE